MGQKPHEHLADRDSNGWPLGGRLGQLGLTQLIDFQYLFLLSKGDTCLQQAKVCRERAVYLSFSCSGF